MGLNVHRCVSLIGESLQKSLQFSRPFFVTTVSRKLALADVSSSFQPVGEARNRDMREPLAFKFFQSRRCVIRQSRCHCLQPIYQ